jgi:CubicO group peptidase (beta-lactamase class C family)
MGPHTCAWGGYGGSLVVNDLDANITVAYVMNRMEPGVLGDTRGASMVAGAVAGLMMASDSR